MGEIEVGAVVTVVWQASPLFGETGEVIAIKPGDRHRRSVWVMFRICKGSGLSRQTRDKFRPSQLRLEGDWEPEERLLYLFGELPSNVLGVDELFSHPDDLCMYKDCRQKADSGGVAWVYNRRRGRVLATSLCGDHYELYHGSEL